jgi:opacity protein-like surface antigen
VALTSKKERVISRARSSLLVMGTLMLLVMASGSSAWAKVEEDMKNFEIFAGNYDPEPDVLDSDPTFGVRFGWDVSRRFGVRTELSLFSQDGDFTSGMTTGNLDITYLFADVSFIAFLWPDSRASLELFGGGGGAFNDIEVSITSGPGAGLALGNISDDSFILHVGGGVRIQLGENIYLRPEGRLRYFENRDDDEMDQLLTLAVGWNFD